MTFKNTNSIFFG